MRTENPIKILLDNLIAGDDQTWRMFLGEICPVIRTLCFSYGLNEFDCDDIFQTLLIKLLENNCLILRKFDSEKGSIFAWVKVITARIIIDKKRKSDLQERWVKVTGEKEPEFSPYDKAEDIEKKVLLEKAVQELTGDERIIYNLFIQDIEDEKIGKILGVTKNTAQQRISRMKRRLRNVIGLVEN